MPLRNFTENRNFTHCLSNRDNLFFLRNLEPEVSKLPNNNIGNGTLSEFGKGAKIAADRMKFGDYRPI